MKTKANPEDSSDEAKDFAVFSLGIDKKRKKKL
jgi:hypothetical protein